MLNRKFWTFKQRWYTVLTQLLVTAHWLGTAWAMLCCLRAAPEVRASRWLGSHVVCVASKFKFNSQLEFQPQQIDMNASSQWIPWSRGFIHYRKRWSIRNEAEEDLLVVELSHVPTWRRRKLRLNRYSSNWKIDVMAADPDKFGSSTASMPFTIIWN